LQEFANKSGCEAWVGVRFNRENWRFLKIRYLPTTEKQYVLSKYTALHNGYVFEDLIRDKPTLNQ